MLPGALAGMRNNPNPPTLSIPEISPSTRLFLKKYGSVAFCTFLVFFYFPSAWQFYLNQPFTQGRTRWDGNGPFKTIDRFETYLNIHKQHFLLCSMISK